MLTVLNHTLLQALEELILDSNDLVQFMQWHCGWNDAVFLFYCFPSWESTVSSSIGGISLLYTGIASIIVVTVHVRHHPLGCSVSSVQPRRSLDAVPHLRKLSLMSNRVKRLKEP